MTDSTTTSTEAIPSVFEQLGSAWGHETFSAWMKMFEAWVQRQGVGEATAGWLSWISFVIAILVVCVLANWAAKLGIQVLIHGRLKRSNSIWGKALIERKVITRLSHLIPVVLLAIGLPLIASESASRHIFAALDIYTLWIMLIVCFGLIDFIGQMYNQRKGPSRTPIKGVLQASKLVLTLIVGLFVLSTLFAKSPMYFLSGVGAFMAIILLIFRDSLLGLVAGLQLTANDMVRVGDWIEIPGKSVDGDVIEVTLTTVRVSNWDRTIAMVPAYDLFQNSFINWRGMAESGGRRIKRSINIDISTIKFASPELLESWQGIKLLKPYLDRKGKEISEWNSQQGVPSIGDINGRQQTNIGAFQAYIEAYLIAHPKIHKHGFTFLIRQLQPGAEGLPIEIYVFTNDNRWEPYEAIQCDIFDHLLAVISHFELEVHEAPSGRDVRVAGLALTSGGPRHPDGH